MTPSLLDHPLIASRYFFPRRVRLPGALEVRSAGVTLACYAYAPHAGAPTVLHFHGNGEVVADHLDDFAPALLAAGLNVFFAEYRGYGGSTGAPTLGAMLDDVEAILAAVGRPANEVVVYGRSVGSIFALELAARVPAVRALVLESGIAEPLERLRLRVSAAELGVTEAALAHEAARRLDHRAKLARYPGPVLLLHAAGDHLVPFDNAERLAAWAGARATLRRFAAGDHNTILLYNTAGIVAAVRDVALATPSVGHQHRAGGDADGGEH